MNALTHALLLLACVSACVGVLPSLGETNRLSAASRVFVREFRFEGNKAVPTKALDAIAAPYRNRNVTSEELEDLRRAITMHYVNLGFINSGAVLPDQSADTGVVSFRIVEGRLSTVEVSGNRWLRDGYIAGRLRAGAGSPVNVNALRETLQILRQNRNVAQVNAELMPGVSPGESNLKVKVADKQPFHAGVQYNNQRPPSVGSQEIVVFAGDRNLTGHSDALELAYGLGRGSQRRWEWFGKPNFWGSYAVPITPYDTTLFFHGSMTDYAVIEEPFAGLDMWGKSYTYGVGLRQPVYRTSRREFALGIEFERRHSETFLMGVPFTFSPGAVDGRTDVSALRLTQEWVDRDQFQVLALRSRFSVGLDVLNSTHDGTDRDGEFVSWLGQAQYIRRLFQTPNQLVLQVAGQWANDPLLSLEQFTVGGLNTVRGYRENQLVRDTGVVANLELRIPVLMNRLGDELLQIAPFVDWGSGWNVHSPTPTPTSIWSAGVGLLFRPTPHFHGLLYWGHPFQQVAGRGHDWQDEGVHFRITVELF